MKPNLRQLEQDVYKYAKMVDEYAMKDVIKYAADYIALMWSFGKNISYKVSVACDENDHYRIIFDWLNPLQTYTANYHERIIKEALSKEVAAKFPNTSVEILVVFPRK